MTTSRHAWSFAAQRLLTTYVGSVFLLLCATLGAQTSASPPFSAARETISVSLPFFNPSIHQTIQLSISVPSAGKVDATVLDPDGGSIRRLSSGKAVAAGSTTLDWDGRDEAGVVVPDEAYGVRVELKSAAGSPTILADGLSGAASPVTLKGYDQQSGVLSYTLAAPSRVLVVATTSSGLSRVIADWQPRSKGAVIEQWNGFDAAGKTYLPGEPGFAIQIQARPLSPGSIITVGNSKETYSEYAAGRKRGSPHAAAQSGKH